MQIPNKLAANWEDCTEQPVSKQSLPIFLVFHPLGITGICLLLCFCVFAYLAPEDRLEDGIMRIVENHPPCAAHWLGCDGLGRDLASRISQAAWMGIELGCGVAVLNIVFGALWGACARLSGRKLGTFLMFLANFFGALPLILVVALARFSWKPGGISGWIMLAILLSMLGWVPMARLVHQGFCKRDQSAGSAAGSEDISEGRLHRFWSLMQGPVLITLSLTIPETLCIEGALSFLGLGLEPPYFSLGSLATEGLLSLRYYPWHFFAPAMALMWLVLSMHWLAEAIQDFFNRSVK